MADSDDNNLLLGKLIGQLESLQSELVQFRADMSRQHERYREDMVNAKSETLGYVDRLIKEVRDRHHDHNNRMQGSFAEFESSVRKIDERVAKIENKEAESVGAARASGSWRDAILVLASGLLSGGAIWAFDHLHWMR